MSHSFLCYQWSSYYYEYVFHGLLPPDSWAIINTKTRIILWEKKVKLSHSFAEYLPKALYLTESKAKSLSKALRHHIIWLISSLSPMSLSPAYTAPAVP